MIQSPMDELHVEEWSRIMGTLEHNVQCEVENTMEDVIAPISPSAVCHTTVRWEQVEDTP